MKLFILCGDAPEMSDSHPFPKPLNMIYGQPSISYVLENLKHTFKELNFIYLKYLSQYNFEETIIKTFPKNDCKFYIVDYYTRGPIETAYIGLYNLDETDEQILFIDNDIVYSLPDMWQTKINKGAFIGYVNTNQTSNDYSFVKIVNDKLIDIKEKKQISNMCCMGMYGFENIRQFKLYSRKRLSLKAPSKLYMSFIYESMIADGIDINAIMIPQSYNIGRLDDNTIKMIKKPKMRICFDLDNTLVTYPTVCGDYTTVKPIKNMIDFVKDLHEDGNTIIIHTARRMNTHSGNIGKVNRDVGKITFDTLEQFHIPYDEIVFGKPYADVYIDDRAINPYKNDFKMFGLFQYRQKDTIINALDTNKFNNLSLKDSHIIKSGDYELLKGQIFYYQNLPKDINSFFPQLYSVKHNNHLVEIEIEYIRGIPMFTLFTYKLLTEDHFKNLLTILDIIHMSKSTSPVPSVEQMSNNYLLKFKKRISDKSVYTFENVDEVSRDCISKLTDYITSPHMKRVDVIHGDLWFSNIIITYEGEIKLIDMRGSVDGFLTLGGDPLYDYAKIYQSLLGYDNILYNKEYPSEYAESLIRIFHNQMISNNIEIAHVQIITKVLIIGTLPFIEDKDVRNRVWNWVNLIL